LGKTHKALTTTHDARSKDVGTSPAFPPPRGSEARKCITNVGKGLMVNGSGTSPLSPASSVSSGSLEEAKSLVDDDKSLVCGPCRSLLSKGVSLVLGNPARLGSSSLPPRLDLTPHVNHTYRFSVTETGTYSITVQDVVGAIGGIGYSTTSVGSWASSFKIDRVTVWPSLSGTVATGASLSWAAGTVGQEEDKVIDRTYPSGVTVTGAVSFRPPKQTLAGFWLEAVDTDAFTLWTMDLTSGSVLDLTVSYTLCGKFFSTGIVVASAVAGEPYYLALDGPASNKIQPVGLPTTA